LGWREFSYSLLYYFPKLDRSNLKSNFDNFPWVYNEKKMTAWKKGKTGYPLIDAGMRQLYQTGYIHNRVRMVVASFLVKNLGIHWRKGEAWFWECLVDADLASNSAGWQWVAGSGADAAPFFRIFNPVTQSKKFDSSGDFIRHYVPELKNMPDKYIHAPFETPENVQREIGVIIGETYPEPIVDLSISRNAALSAYKKTKG
jgi:deoxyribodipyrimidine photo-lyase